MAYYSAIQKEQTSDTLKKTLTHSTDIMFSKRNQTKARQERVLYT